MTVDNCIKLLEAYKKQAEYPVNADGAMLTGDDRKHAIEQSKRNYEMMKQHILKGRKFQGHPIIQELQSKQIEEDKKDGKKSKR